MASGKSHTFINLSSLALVLPLFWYFRLFKDEYLFLAALAAAYGTIFLSPDLDLKQSRSNKAWGWFRWIWYIYHRCFSHRKLSHFIIIGTISRILYLFLIMYFFLVGSLFFVAFWEDLSLKNFLSAQDSIGSIVYHAALWISSRVDYCAAIFVGLVFSDTMHLLTDLISSAFRRPS